MYGLMLSRNLNQQLGPLSCVVLEKYSLGSQNSTSQPISSLQFSDQLIVPLPLVHDDIQHRP